MADIILPQQQFLRMLGIEEKRTERSHRPLVLVLIESPRLFRDGDSGGTLGKTLTAVSGSTRETDLKGWYQQGTVLGIIFTELTCDAASRRTIANVLLAKVSDALKAVLRSDQFTQIIFSARLFPSESGDETNEGPPDANAELRTRDHTRATSAQVIKRAVDIVGSALALTLFAPLMIGIAAAIKLTSRGPILFRQRRVGLRGQKFIFLKFRSMYKENDPAIHREYVTRFISGTADASNCVYKLTADPRVTPLGRLLRKSSLDELPQLINVLKGDMSLVGPRPAIPYEVERYKSWHRRRFLAVKPGITGLWQVHGRSRTTFDEMVRLDLKYAESWSIWMDITILLETPLAVLRGEGAY